LNNLNILAIGNSFSQDATRYIHRITRSDGFNLNVTNLYISGCPIDRHFRNMISGSRDYELEYNGELTFFKVSLEEALLNREWDYITIQQASHRSSIHDATKRAVVTPDTAVIKRVYELTLNPFIFPDITIKKPITVHSTLLIVFI